jgi:hypothetical protein
MGPDVVKGESLAEFFRCFVDEAMVHQNVEALDLTRYYLVQLLAGHARCGTAGTGPTSDEPLALRFARALETGGFRQRTELRGLADHALFISGFFSDSLARRAVDVDYYASLGGYAYQQLSVWESDTLSPAYAELGHRFVAFADVLTEVSERSGLTSDRDLLRLYERWVHFGSTRCQERLRRRGITPTLQARAARLRVQ